MTFKDIIKAREAHAQLKKDYFFEFVLFSYQWWFLLVLTIGLWIGWLVILDKKRLTPILYVGLISSLIATISDDIGVTSGLWTYPYKLTYFSNQLYPVDFAIIPVGYMLLYQFFHIWKHYLIALLVLSVFATFVVESVFVRMDIYLLLKWKHWYSSPFYFLIGALVKYSVDKLCIKQSKLVDNKTNHF
ncbi:CBO0543 family protein [Virgibacillus flavescens]|uniref:CBO0543 family protein n=1 Tax=Virgibacillus flavescens TaxID=1611422 RepID=UPI003D32A347